MVKPYLSGPNGERAELIQATRAENARIAYTFEVLGPGVYDTMHVFIDPAHPQQIPLAEKICFREYGHATVIWGLE